MLFEVGKVSSKCLLCYIVPLSIILDNEISNFLLRPATVNFGTIIILCREVQEGLQQLSTFLYLPFRAELLNWRVAAP